MWAEELVGRADQEVAAQGLHIDGAVGGELNCVNVDQGAGGFGQGGELGGGVDRAQGVGGVAESDQGRLFGHGGFEVFQVQLAGGGVKVYAAHAAAGVGGEVQPGRDVGVVVEVGDDDGVAGADALGQGMAEAEGERGHVGAEHDFLGARGVEEVGHGGASFVDQRVRGAAG